ncbi:MAG: carotenoid oxygenase family protein [Actinomycetota bacterium]|nr:carotenoid oxygenase family protein [Actinomycetota bacterium]
MRSDRVTDAKGWPAVRGPRHGEGDSTADTNLIVHAGRNLALVEAGALPVELRYELDTVSRTDLAGSLPGGFTAHPKRDPATGERHAVAYYWRWDYLQYLVVGTDGHLRRRVDVPAAGSPMAHDMALTASFVVLLDLPVTFDVHAAASGASFPYRWNPSPPLREEPGQPGAGVRAPPPRCSRGRRLGALLRPRRHHRHLRRGDPRRPGLQRRSDCHHHLPVRAPFGFHGNWAPDLAVRANVSIRP